MKKGLFYLVAVVGLVCTSCGKGIYPVSGKVTYKGTPAAGATVFLYRQTGDPMNEPSIMGIVGEDGGFTLVTGSLGQGAPPGEYDVLVEWKQGPKRGKGHAHKRFDRLKGRYADRQRPRLHAAVKAETNVLDPFELTD
jgi:hypothetical protein